MAEQYREISFTRMLESGEDPYEADMRVVFDIDGRSYRRIVSRMRPGVYADVMMEGDAKIYERRLLHEKKVMADFDDANRVGRPILKEVRAAVQAPCPSCHGEGEAPDKHGNWKDCRHCKGAGYVSG